MAYGMYSAGISLKRLGKIKRKLTVNEWRCLGLNPEEANPEQKHRALVLHQSDRQLV